MKINDENRRKLTALVQRLNQSAEFDGDSKIRIADILSINFEQYGIVCGYAKLMLNTPLLEKNTVNKLNRKRARNVIRFIINWNKLPNNPSNEDKDQVSIAKDLSNYLLSLVNNRIYGSYLKERAAVIDIVFDFLNGLIDEKNEISINLLGYIEHILVYEDLEHAEKILEALKNENYGIANDLCKTMNDELTNSFNTLVSLNLSLQQSLNNLSDLCDKKLNTKPPQEIIYVDDNTSYFNYMIREARKKLNIIINRIVNSSLNVEQKEKMINLFHTHIFMVELSEIEMENIEQLHYKLKLLGAVLIYMEYDNISSENVFDKYYNFLNNALNASCYFTMLVILQGWNHERMGPKYDLLNFDLYDERERNTILDTVIRRNKCIIPSCSVVKPEYMSIFNSVQEKYLKDDKNSRTPEELEKNFNQMVEIINGAKSEEHAIFIGEILKLIEIPFNMLCEFANQVLDTDNDAYEFGPGYYDVVVKIISTLYKNTNADLPEARRMEIFIKFKQIIQICLNVDYDTLEYNSGLDKLLRILKIIECGYSEGIKNVDTNSLSIEQIKEIVEHIIAADSIVQVNNISNFVENKSGILPGYLYEIINILMKDGKISYDTVVQYVRNISYLSPVVSMDNPPALCTERNGGCIVREGANIDIIFDEESQWVANAILSNKGPDVSNLRYTLVSSKDLRCDHKFSRNLH